MYQLVSCVCNMMTRLVQGSSLSLSLTLDSGLEHISMLVSAVLLFCFMGLSHLGFRSGVGI